MVHPLPQAQIYGQTQDRALKVGQSVLSPDKQCSTRSSSHLFPYFIAFLAAKHVYLLHLFSAELKPTCSQTPP